MKFFILLLQNNYLIHSGESKVTHWNIIVAKLSHGLKAIAGVVLTELAQDSDDTIGALLF